MSFNMASMELLVLMSFLFCGLTYCMPQQGYWVTTMDKDNFIASFVKSMYKGSQVSISITCEWKEDRLADISLQYFLRRSPCAQEYSDIPTWLAADYLKYPDKNMFKEVLYPSTEYITGIFSKEECLGKLHFYIPLQNDKPVNVTYKTESNKENTETDESRTDRTAIEKAKTRSNGPPARDSVRQKRDAVTADLDEGQAMPASAATLSPTIAVPGENSNANSNATTTTEQPSFASHENVTTDLDEGLTTTASTATFAPPDAVNEDNSNATTTTEQPSFASHDKVTADFDEGQTKAASAATFAPAIATTEETSNANSNAPTATTEQPSFASHDKIDPQPAIKVWKDGYYLLVLALDADILPKDFKLEVRVQMMKDDNYIAAEDEPLLTFFGVMCLILICMSIVWLITLACNWMAVLRIHFWIAGCILLALLENAVFLMAFENINMTGRSVRATFILATLVSCLKRSCLRMLLVIISLGFGITMPRLGTILYKVLLVGVVYMVLASIEGCRRILAATQEESMLITVPLSLTDIFILGWIVKSLRATAKAVRLQGNQVQVRLYRLFITTVLLAVVACVTYMIWFLDQHRFNPCITAWKGLWVHQAFWRILDSVLLLVIMILWRPIDRSDERYAFSPLFEASEDGDAIWKDKD